MQIGGQMPSVYY